MKNVKFDLNQKPKTATEIFGKLTMKTINFNINEKPKLAVENVAYLVDESNVDLLRQYVNKYYPDNITCLSDSSSWTEWFNNHISIPIESNINDKFILYFKRNSLGWDDSQKAVAYDDGYDIYYVVEAKPGKQLMKVE